MTKVEERDVVLTDEEIVAIRKATKASTASLSKPWADTLAFARAIEQAVISKEK